MMNHYLKRLKIMVKLVKTLKNINLYLKMDKIINLLMMIKLQQKLEMIDSIALSLEIKKFLKIK